LRRKTNPKKGLRTTFRRFSKRNLRAKRCYTLHMRSVNSAATRRKPDAKEYGYTVIYQRMPEGGYSVVVPAIPEICTFGETLYEARRMAKDALRCFLESALKTGEPIPKDVEPATEHIAVSVA